MTSLALAELDWGTLAPLRLTARTLCEGLYSGAHRSLHRAEGVEFAGHREYTPGDDLRWLDARASQRHGRLLGREFGAERRRTLGLLLDASLSMGFRSAQAPGSKLAFAAVMAAALAHVALSGQDAVALDWLGGDNVGPLRALSGRAAFEQLAAALEGAHAGGDLLHAPERVPGPIHRMNERTRAGSVLVVFSDLIDLPDGSREELMALTTHRRRVVVVQVLDPIEAELTFKGPTRLSALEGQFVTEVEGARLAAAYRQQVESVRTEWRERLVARGGALVTSCTDEPLLSVLREILRAAGGGAP